MRIRKGKLVRTRWVASEGKAPCYTCQYHDWDKLTPSSTVRVREFEHVTEKTFFCADHAVSAHAAEVAA